MSYEFNGVTLARMGIFLKTKRDTEDFAELALAEFETRIGFEIDRLGRAGEIEYFEIDDPEEAQVEWYRRNEEVCSKVFSSCYEELCQEILRDKARFPGVVQDFPPALREIDLEELDLSVRAFNNLKRAGLNTVGAIFDHGDLSDIRNLGKRCCIEVMEKLMQLLWEACSESD